MVRVYMLGMDPRLKRRTAALAAALCAWGALAPSADAARARRRAKAEEPPPEEEEAPPKKAEKKPEKARSRKRGREVALDSYDAGLAAYRRGDFAGA